VRLLLVGTPNLHSDAVDGMTVGIPDRAEDQRVRLFLVGFTRHRLRWKANNGDQKNDD
jgi:hypothetical protein